MNSLKVSYLNILKMFLEQEREVSDITLRMSFFKKQVKRDFEILLKPLETS